MIDLDYLEQGVRAGLEANPVAVVALVAEVRRLRPSRQWARRWKAAAKKAREALFLEQTDPLRGSPQLSDERPHRLLVQALEENARLMAQNNRLRVVLAEYADRGSWACSRNTDHRDLWLPYEHGYSRAWDVLEQEWPARAALGGEARDAE
jgi:hypothetical protein